MELIILIMPAIPKKVYSPHLPIEVRFSPLFSSFLSFLCFVYHGFVFHVNCSIVVKLLEINQSLANRYLDKISEKVLETYEELEFMKADRISLLQAVENVAEELDALVS